MANRLAERLAQSWWMFLVQGILALLFGVLTLVRPRGALTALVFLFGAWAFIDGSGSVAVAVTHRSWKLLLLGLIGVVAGFITFIRPEVAAIGLYVTIAAWSILRGVVEIVVGIELRRQIKNELWLLLGGAASIVLGVLLIAIPAAGILAVAWIVALYALVFGGLMLALSLRLRGFSVPGSRRPLPNLR